MIHYKFGEIVLVNFPFTSGNASKKRPALVVCDTSDNDVVLMRVTSQQVDSDFDIEISDWNETGLLTKSWIRIHKVATFETSLINKKIGHLSPDDKTKIANFILKKVKEKTR